ncbi:NEL domain-containing protein [Pseudomonas donghuensis]|uniref:dermonecrotic toxin domain-containing protein n=1 Tax=Pseudomonas donghuensis TaxID=1163398 RepID=UPI0039E1B8B0
MPDINPHHAFLRQRLPGWAHHANQENWQHLRQSLHAASTEAIPGAPVAQHLAVLASQAQLRRSRDALHHLLKPLQGVMAFAEPLLSARLKDAFGLEVDVIRSTLTPVTTNIGGLLTGRDITGPTASLLQYALHNFSGIYLDPPSAIRDARGQALAISGLAFAAECRRLDLGRRYQDHLDALLVYGEQARQVRNAFEQVSKDQLRLDLLLAHGQKRLSDAGKSTLDHLLAGSKSLKLGTQPVHCWSLSLFGIALHDVWVLAPTESEAERIAQVSAQLSTPLALFNPLSIFSPRQGVLDRHRLRTVGPVLLCLPGTSHAVQQYPSLQALQRALKDKLCNAQFRAVFMRFVPLEQRAHFASVLKRTLAANAAADAHWPVPAFANLHVKRQLIKGELFNHEQTAQLNRLRNEARLLAVPTADVDDKAREVLLQGLEDLGLNFLNLAAFFVPGLGQVMMGVFAAQLLYSAFEGVEAWEDGDIDTALAHLQSIALNVAVAGGLAVAGGVAGKLVNGQWLESLLRVQRADGSPRLWQPSLASYRSDIRLPEGLRANAMGQYVADGKYYIRLDGELFEQQLDPASRQWRIVHPQDPGAYQPPLLHNNQGAWRHVYERPLQWSRATLLRRLGHPVEAYSDQQLSEAAWISGTSEDTLRRVHVQHEQPPELLLDCLERLQAANTSNAEVDRLGDITFDDAFAKHYAGPPAGVSTLQLALPRALEGLYQPRLANDDCERLVFACLKRLPGWPDSLRLELRRGNPDGPLIAQVGPRQASEHRVLVKAAEYRHAHGWRAYRTGMPLAESSSNRYQAILDALPDADRQALALQAGDGDQLGRRILGLTQANRDQLSQWLWSYEPGWSDSIGLRGGAPMSYGPTSPSTSLMARYWALYPRSSQAQMRAAMEGWRAANVEPTAALQRLEMQLQRLRNNLQRWAIDNPQRQEAIPNLIEAWQRMHSSPTAQGQPVFALYLDELNLVGADLDGLAQLEPGIFAHVQLLSLDFNPLGQLPGGFTQHFPRLRNLSVRGSQLSEVPQGLGEQLVSLELGDNQLAWTARDQARLATYPNLQHLYLDNNPIASAPNFGGHLYLRHLTLSGCGLTELPGGLENLQAPTLIDLSNNLLTHLPEHFDPPRAVGHALQLELNPFTEETALQIQRYFTDNRVDLLVSQDAYSDLLFQASDDQVLLWERLQVPQRLDFVRRLRELYDSFSYLLAPATTRRRLWRILQVVETQPPVDEWLAQYAGGARILLLEDMVDGVLALSGNDHRQLGRNLLQVMQRRTWRQAIQEHVERQTPLEDAQFAPRAQRLEALYYWTLRQLAEDPTMIIAQTPLPAEALATDSIQITLQQLPADWVEQLHQQLLALTPDSDAGVEAVLRRNEQHQYLNRDWTTYLRLHFAERFDELGDELNQRLQAVQQEIANPGERLLNEQLIRRRHEAEEHQLLSELTQLVYRDSPNEE